MSCLSNTFIIDAPNCGPKMGGIRALLWGAGITCQGIDITPGSDYQASGFSGTFQRIPVRGSFQCVAQVNEDEGTVFYRSEFAFSPSGYHSGDPAIAYLLAAFSEMGDEDITVLAEDWNGVCHVMGWGLPRLSGTVKRFPLWLATGQDATGTEHADRTGFDLTLASQHPLPALRIMIENVTIANPSND